MASELISEINKDRFHQYLVGFSRNIMQSFVQSIAPPRLLLHLVAILLTIPLVTTGLDWNYFIFFRQHYLLQTVLFPAVIVGGLVPFFLPPILYLYGKKHDQPQLEPLAFALTQVVVVGLFWSSLYKSFTGRMGPDFDEYETGVADYSQEFYFGVLRGGVFEGWPSGHTTIAWGLAIVWLFYKVPNTEDLPDGRIRTLLERRWVAIIYAFYIALGVSTNIHWLSDVIAGILIGITVGLSTAKIYQDNWDQNSRNVIERDKLDRTVYAIFGLLGLIVVFSVVKFRDFP